MTEAAGLLDPHLTVGTAPAGREKLGLRGVSRHFGAVHALDRIDASIPEGAFVTLIGPSGCGKSTLFNILAGLLEPDPGGSVALDGMVVPPGGLLGRVAFMPQRDLLLPWRSVLDNAILAAEVQGQPKKEARALAREMARDFGLAGFEDHFPQQLSGGMRQRVALMRTFLFDRDVMLLDEPFGALDALTRSLMQRWLLDIWSRYRRTIVFITHDIDEAIFLADRVLVMGARPGRIRMDRAIDLPRPRAAALITAPEFTAIKRELLEVLEEESLKTFQAGQR
ncbi:ABC-type nitrate/sulfonate/bicarbonate transport system ATPase subunit [Humitalea rosea]|uniref:ABC-type nitrate/sulfonate/bicarbonate transport system ATPase subunit n=1 Tax=Humitalea rosea TaxID=990373 RepID=A0A2W7J959_9PROT|nr:ABC transporter ATP-binding protein [Humitalea rosea]PZW48396.1 ABC-type nitrate/sulfonate/bicarbonate transport system ATPase subunit [Humitalea rosea]